MTFTNSTILITGGGSGIGRGLAEKLSAMGNRVIIAGRTLAALSEVKAANPSIEVMTLDQSDAADITRFAAEIIRRYPELNVVINNAGIQRSENLQLGEVALAEAQITSNLLGPIRLTAALLPYLLTRPESTLINVTSALGFVPSAMIPTYSATKAALHSYTQSLRFQLSATRVKVLEIIPPWVQTGLQGEKRGNDPRAMPLDDYIEQTIALLWAPPENGEIVVEAAKALRFAEQRGNYQQLYTASNQQRAQEYGNPPAVTG